MKIRAIASAIPDNIEEAKDIANWANSDLTYVSEKIGVNQRGILASDESGISLATKAVEKLLTSTGIKTDSIELLIYVTQTPDHIIPHNSAILLDNIGAMSSIAAFDMSLGCSGYPYALVTAKAFMSLQKYQRALIVTCDPYSKIVSRSDKATAALFGDAATATLLDIDGMGNIGVGDFGTDGSRWQTLMLPKGRGTFPSKNEYRLYMKGFELAKFVLSTIPKSIEKVLSVNNMTLGDVDKLAFHQGSKYLLQKLLKELKISDEKLLTNLEKYGNTVSSSIPLLLEEFLQDNGGKKSCVLISGFGVGLSWGSLLLDFEQVCA